MARFTGTLEQTFTTPADLDTCKAHFLDLDAVRRCYPGLDHAETLDDATLKLTLQERQQMGERFVGTYTCRWAPTDTGVQWRTLGDGNNMWVDADLTFTPTGTGTSIHWHQTLALELNVNRIVARMLQPVVSRLIARGMRDYADQHLAELAARQAS
jgi:carbon monoxide dehydrogenase subunit G